MKSSVSGQDEPNLALTHMELSFTLGIWLCPARKICVLSHIINPLLTKLVRSRWLDIGLVLFCMFMDQDVVEVPKHTKKELGQYPCSHLDRTSLVNNQITHGSMYDCSSYRLLLDKRKPGSKESMKKLGNTNSK